MIGLVSLEQFEAFREACLRLGMTEKIKLLDAIVARWLQAREARGRFVFCTISAGQATGYGAGQELRPGRAVSPRYVRQMVGRLAKRAGLEGRVTPHTLRHTFATRFLRATGNLEVTRTALRHARIQTTAGTYSHLVQEDVDRGIRQLPGGEQAPGEDLQAQIAALWVQLETLECQYPPVSVCERRG